jgi:DNA-binding SARP family transcriptional activator
MYLTLCGRITLARDHVGEEVTLATKAAALLAYLALEPASHSRDALSSLLWGESTEVKARASLRQALKQLKDALGEHLRLDRTSVQLATTVACDVMQFRQLVESNDPRALDVDIPRLLHGVSFRDAPAFDEWAEQQRMEWLRPFRRALTTAARAAHAQRDWPRAWSFATRWQALDAFSDDAAHLLIDVQHRMGDRDNALESYRAYAALRERETGQLPGLALRELATRIAHAPAASAPVPPRRAVTRHHEMPSFEGPLVGREPAWSSLLRGWQTVAAGTGAMVLVDGESGTGKSRLLRDFSQFVVSHEATLLSGRAFESGVDVPYGPMLDIVRGAIHAPGAAGTDGLWLAEVARVVPDARKLFPSIPDASRTATTSGSPFPEAVAQLFLALAEESPLVIVLDDLHWCDGDSCQLLHYLVQRLSAAPVLWCFAKTLGVSERDAPAVRLTRALRAVPNAVRVSLESLTGDQVWHLIRGLGRVTHPDGARRLAARVHDVAGGNPLYVIELLKSLFARGWLTVDRDTQEWIHSDSMSGELLAAEVFPDVHAAVAERIAALPDEQHALLLTIATTGGPCHTSLLSYVHGISRLRAAHVCDALVERRLVTEANGHYLCANRIIGHVVLDAMGTSRRREVHRMISLALTDAAVSMSRTPEPGAIARHADAGGEPAMAHRYALLASESSAAQSAWADALGWLDLASACALTPDEQRAADQATAGVLAMAGLSKLPSRPVTTRATRVIGADDMDLAGSGVSRPGLAT